MPDICPYMPALGQDIYSYRYPCLTKISLTSASGEKADRGSKNSFKALPAVAKKSLRLMISFPFSMGMVVGVVVLAILSGVDARGVDTIVKTEINTDIDDKNNSRNFQKF